MRQPRLPSDGRPLPHWVISFLIFAITFVVFFHSIRNAFVNWDDDELFLYNDNYHGLDWKHLSWILTNTLLGLYRPLGWLLWAVEYQLWGLNPAGYHLVSVLLHATNAVVFYFISVRLLGIAMGYEVPRGRNGLGVASMVAALLFAIHPLRVEVVAWASAQPYTLSGLFFLLSVLSYLKAAGPWQENIWRRIHLMASFAFFGIALLALSIAITLPFILVILDIYPLQRLRGKPREWFGKGTLWIWCEKVPFLLLSFVGIIHALIATSVHRHADFHGPIDRLAIAAYGVAFYLWKTINPVGLLPSFYELPRPINPFDWPFLSGAIATSAVTVGIFAVRRRWAAGLAIWISYLVMVGPNLGVVQHGSQLAANRYTYLSCLGLAVLGGGGLLSCYHRATSHRKIKHLLPFILIVSAATLTGMGVMSWKMVFAWRDSTSLWGSTLNIDPENYTAHYQMAGILHDIGKLDEAIKHYREALRIWPGNATTYNNLGLVLAEQGKVDEAIANYEMAIRIKPDIAAANNNLGLALIEKGKLDEAVLRYRQALMIAPDYMEAHNNLANALTRQGKTDEAIEHLMKVLQLHPNNVIVRYNLMLVYLTNTNFRAAWEQARILEKLGDPRAGAVLSHLEKISPEPKPEVIDRYP